MNMYTAKDIRAIINWMGHDKLTAFLESHGIHPTHEVRTPKRTYRLYDEAALTKCNELRTAREREQGLIKVPEPKAAPDLYAMLKQMQDELAAIRKQVDFLAKELSGQTAIFDDEGSGGTD